MVVFETDLCVDAGDSLGVLDDDVADGFVGPEKVFVAAAVPPPQVQRAEKDLLFGSPQVNRPKKLSFLRPRGLFGSTRGVVTWCDWYPCP